MGGLRPLLLPRPSACLSMTRFASLSRVIPSGFLSIVIEPGGWRPVHACLSAAAAKEVSLSGVPETGTAPRSSDVTVIAPNFPRLASAGLSRLACSSTLQIAQQPRWGFAPLGRQMVMSPP